MNHPSYFAIIPADVRYCKELEPCARLLYGEITCLTSKEGYCWASNSYFAQLYEVDERTVKRWLKSLHELGFIKVEIKKEGLKWERKIWIKNMFTKGQKCPDEDSNDSTEENPSTDTFQRRDKNVPIDGTKMSPYYNIANKQEQQHKENVAAALRSEKLNSLLALLPFSEDEKNSFSKNFDENQINHAIQFYKAKLEIQPDFKPQGTWIAFLTSAVKKMWPIPSKPEKSTAAAENIPNVEENKAKAKEIYELFKDSMIQSEEYIELYQDRFFYRNFPKDLKESAFYCSKKFDIELDIVKNIIKNSRRK